MWPHPWKCANSATARGCTPRHAAGCSRSSQASEALDSAAQAFRALASRPLAVELKGRGDPVTAVDRALNQRLWRLLLRDGAGWLSEETTDDLSRLKKRRVWVVDPLDGTREFVAGIPEWCISIGLVEDGRAVAGGICNPATGEVFLGSQETGVTVNGQPARQRVCRDLKDAVVLASRSEISRGEWKIFEAEPFVLCPMGSVAYKLARVAAGLADATWTLVPKHEWDVAAGVALVLAAGGVVKTLTGLPPVFNRPEPRYDGLLAFLPASQNLLESLVLERGRDLPAAPLAAPSRCATRPE